VRQACGSASRCSRTRTRARIALATTRVAGSRQVQRGELGGAVLLRRDFTVRSRTLADERGYVWPHEPVRIKNDGIVPRIE
jgi:hypothetical protein